LDQSITIALDGMGGDNAPLCVIEGAELALKRTPNIHFLIYGDQEQLSPLLDEHLSLIHISEPTRPY